jgi:hypothetical protein
MEQNKIDLRNAGTVPDESVLELRFLAPSPPNTSQNKLSIALLFRAKYLGERDGVRRRESRKLQPC